MSPLQIEIILHYYAHADEWRNGEYASNPFYKDLFGRMMDDGLLTFANFHVERFEDGTLKARYEPTDRLRAYVGALMNTPLPIQKWVMPNEEKHLNAN